MIKLGRNEPCHCGSGKKYKKCCLEKDEATVISDNQYENSSDSEWDNDLDFSDGFDEDNEDDLEYYNEGDDEYIPELYEEDGQDENIEGHLEPELNDYPGITEEENKLIDLWYEKYLKIEDPKLLMGHIKDFLENNRIEACRNLGLEEDVLFELTENSLKAGIIDETMEFIIALRDKYPEIYRLSAGFYDSDIIVWLCYKKRTNEIGKYLSYFEQYPLEWIDKLYGTIEFLLSQGVYKELIPFTKKVSKLLWYSNEVINGYSIADIPFNEIVFDYLGIQNQEKDIKELIAKLKTLELNFNDSVYDPDYWQIKFAAFDKAFGLWDVEIPKKREQFANKVARICDNYLRYLYQNKKLPLHIAYHYSNCLYKYYIDYTDQKKLPNNMFEFRQNMVDKTIGRIANDFMGLNVPLVMSVINTLVMFAEYLELCGNYSTDAKASLMAICHDFYKTVYNSHKDSVIETLAFEKFPLF